MATFITIIDTAKPGFFTVDTNALYTSGAVSVKQMNISKGSVNEINIMKDSLGKEYIDIQVTNSEAGFTISNDLTQSRYFLIESVNGVAPTSIDDLKTQILNLL